MISSSIPPLTLKIPKSHRALASRKPLTKIVLFGGGLIAIGAWLLLLDWVALQIVAWILD
jgi:hypothetical protein